MSLKKGRRIEEGKRLIQYHTSEPKSSEKGLGEELGYKIHPGMSNLKLISLHQTKG